MSAGKRQQASPSPLAERPRLLLWGVDHHRAPTELREQVALDDGGEAFPALVDQEDTTGIRLFESAEEAAEHHRFGLRRLLESTLRDKFRYLHRSLEVDQLMCLQYAAVDTCQKCGPVKLTGIRHHRIEVACTIRCRRLRGGVRPNGAARAPFRCRPRALPRRKS